MKIAEYKITKFRTFRGHDGQGFNATLSHNGKPVALVDDDGYGGGLAFDWLDHKNGREDYTVLDHMGETVTHRMTAEEYAFFEAYKDLTYVFEYNNSVNRHSADTIIGALIEEYELSKKAKKKTLYKLKGQEGWYSANIPYDSRVEQYLVKKFGDRLLTIFNRDGYWKTETNKKV